MDKLQWFKFAPSDWMMGKIQRCPEVTQARFLRLSCLYWNKECNLSYEDAEIEIDKEHLDVLVKKKIIKVLDDFIFLDFLDEQMEGIIETSTKRRDAVNKRWAKAKQNDTKEIQTDTSVLQSDTDKSRVERDKSRVDKNIESIYLLYPSKCVVKQSSTGKSSKVNKEQIKKLFKDYSLKDLTLIIERYINDCKTGNIYMKNFKTFLNNIPDYDLKDINTMQRTEHMTKGYCKMLLKVPAMLQEVLKKGYTVEQINTWAGC